MASENTPLLPEPTTASSPQHSKSFRWRIPVFKSDGVSSHDPAHKHAKRRAYALYAVLLLLGIGIGVGATLGVEHTKPGQPPMVPPVFKLPPVCLVC